MKVPSPPRCPLCHEEVDAVPAEGLSVCDVYPEDVSVVQNRRAFESGTYVILHHGCTSMRARTNWSDDQPYWHASFWWACNHPERPLDANAHFDLYCPDCAERWSATDS